MSISSNLICQNTWPYLRIEALRARFTFFFQDTPFHEPVVSVAQLAQFLLSIIFSSYSKMIFCRNFQNGVTLLWDQRQILFTNRGPETFFALTMMSVWIMLSNVAGSIGNVLSAPTNWGNYPQATSEPFTTGALTMSSRCGWVKWDREAFLVSEPDSCIIGRK